MTTIKITIVIKSPNTFEDWQEELENNELSDALHRGNFILDGETIVSLVVEKGD